MLKIKRFSELAVFAAFSFAAILALRFFTQERMVFLHYGCVVAAQVIIAFFIGIFLNSVHKKLVFSFQLYYLIVSIVCLVLIIPLYTFYEHLPLFIKMNFSEVQSFLSLYAGANLFSALFGSEP